MDDKNKLKLDKQTNKQKVKAKKQKEDHVTPILGQQHWLPVQKRIFRKILRHIRSDQENTSLCLSDLFHRHTSSRLLSSASRSVLDVPRPTDSKTKRYGQRAPSLSHASSLWNVLPESIKDKGLHSVFQSYSEKSPPQLGRRVDATVCDVRSHWCMSELLYHTNLYFLIFFIFYICLTPSLAQPVKFPG